MDLTDVTRIEHMIDAAESALRFVNGRRREELESDQMLTFAEGSVHFRDWSGRT